MLISLLNCKELIDGFKSRHQHSNALVLCGYYISNILLMWLPLVTILVVRKSIIKLTENSSIS